MPVIDPVKTNFLYRVSYGSGNVERWTNVAENQDFNGETYTFKPLIHTRPKFSAEPQEAEVTLTVHEKSNPIADLFTLGPPPYQIILDIWEYDRDADTIDEHYHGWIVRPSFDLRGSIVNFRCKSVWHFFERESFTDSLAALSRYSIYDPRAGVDIEQFRTGITVDDLNDERDVLTVSGITQDDGYFNGGLIVAPDRDARTILQHVTEGGDKKLYISGAFPQFTLDTGFTADIYPGDDLTYDTWATKFASVTNFGEAHGGWPYMPDKDPQTAGVS